MTFQELFDEVIIITKRPDLVDRTKQQLRAATLKAHHSDFYYKDIVEVPVQFNSATILQNFIPAEVVPKFRKVKYIRPWISKYPESQSPEGMAGRFLTAIQIENSLDAYNYMKSDVYYMAGQALQIRASAPLYRVLFGCYVHPTIAPEASYSSWIADEMPYAIIYEAARAIFKSINFTEQSNEYTTMVAEQFQELKLSYVDDVPLT